jgi:hypothetical protein
VVYRWSDVKEKRSKGNTVSEERTAVVQIVGDRVSRAIAQFPTGWLLQMQPSG